MSGLEADAEQGREMLTGRWVVGPHACACDRASHASADALKHFHEVPLDGPLARASGVLCGAASTADVVDASVAVVGAARSRRGDVANVTSDPDDPEHLIDVLHTPVRVDAI